MIALNSYSGPKKMHEASHTCKKSWKAGVSTKLADTPPHPFVDSHGKLLFAGIDLTSAEGKFLDLGCLSLLRNALFFVIKIFPII